MKIPPSPEWNRAVDGIGNCHEWASEYERSLLPDGIVFPQHNQVWEVTRDGVTCFLSLMRQSFLPWGGRVQLSRGTQVIVINTESQPLEIRFKPVRGTAMLKEIWPAALHDKLGELEDYWLTLPLAPSPYRYSHDGGFFVDLFKLTTEYS